MIVSVNHLSNKDSFQMSLICTFVFRCVNCHWRFCQEVYYATSVTGFDASCCCCQCSCQHT